MLIVDDIVLFRLGTIHSYLLICYSFSMSASFSGVRSANYSNCTV